MLKENNQLMPIIGPILNLLRSRKFMVALMTLIVDVVVAYVPAMAEVQEPLLAVFTAIGLALVAAIAYEDAASTTNGSKETDQ
ncbi:MAG: hypothetical protein JXJ17_06345 [Anaerolineae bacterium]|nr:hypothetical protein [Anaerolineae bacterium]